MATMADVYRALNALVEEKIVEKYAVCGGTAALFYAETTLTYDIDIFVVIEQKSLLVDLSQIYRWARARSYEVHQEHLLVHGVPVQILSASPGLETEAVNAANLLNYDGIDVPVIKPEYLILLYLKAANAKRRGRALDLWELPNLDRILFRNLVEKYSMQSECLKNGVNL